MAYSPQTWVDGTTPVDAAHMTHIETGIATVEADLSGRVTAVEGRTTTLETNAAALEPRVTAVEGRVGTLEGTVNSNHEPRIVTLETNAAALEPRVTAVEGRTTTLETSYAALEPRVTSLEGRVAALEAAGGGSAVGYGTALPAGPVDGQEFILVDSVSDPTYQWRLRYNAASASPHKWECVGGTPWVKYAPNTFQADLPGQWKDFSNIEPFFNPPVNGDYIVSLSFVDFFTGNAPSFSSKFGVCAGGPPDGNQWMIVQVTTSPVNGPGYTYPPGRTNRMNGCAVGSQIRIQGWIDTGMMTAYYPTMTVEPARLG